jgi:tripartite-type tricarboxylate transporter receptor subunit TctC
MIIDCHGHYTTAPAALEAWRKMQIDCGGDRAAMRGQDIPIIADDQIRESLEKTQLRLQRERGTDLTIFSPRAGGMGHHISTEEMSHQWSRICNDLIKRICDLYPNNFAPLCQLPQSPGCSPSNSIPELVRCVKELGFIGCNLNPDPSGGYWTDPPLPDPWWFDLFEKLVELDVPAMIHVSHSCNPNFHFTGAHYINGDTTAFMQLLTSNLFERFPALRLIIPHGGGGGIIGNTYVAKQSKPDGYTVGILANPTLIINILGQGAHFAKNDIEPIAGITFAPVIWVVRTKSKLGNMDFKQIIAYAKKHPDELKVGVIPNASFDMATRIVAKQTGAKFTIVPFQGGKPAVVALLGGNIDMSAIYYSEVDQYVKAGTLKVVAVADNTPVPQAPHAPTMKAMNINMASSTWGADRFACVPKGTPKDRKNYLGYLIQKTLADPKTAEAYKKVGIIIAPKTAAQEQKAYDDAYVAVHDFLKETGKLKASK